METAKGIATWHEEKTPDIHYPVVRLHDLDEGRIIKIEQLLEEIKKLLKEKRK